MTDEAFSPAILTERLILRRWREGDRAPFAAMSADPRVMEFFPRPLDRQASDAVIDALESHARTHGFTFWALEERASGRFAGFTGLMHVNFLSAAASVVEIAWRLPADLWGRGLASEAARAALAHGFGSLELPAIVAFTAAGNERSRRVMERIGMQRIVGGDFLHPLIAADHPLQPYALYRALPETS